MDAERLFGIEIANIPIIDVQQELDWYRALIRDEGFRARLGIVGHEIDIGRLVWRDLPKDLLTYMVQRGILAVEACVDAAVEYQAHFEGLRGQEFIDKRKAVWSSGGSANTYYNRLPGILNAKYMLCNCDQELWGKTKQFYSEIRNPLFHGYQPCQPNPDSVQEIQIGRASCRERV